MLKSRKAVCLLNTYFDPISDSEEKQTIDIFSKNDCVTLLELYTFTDL